MAGRYKVKVRARISLAPFHSLLDPAPCILLRMYPKDFCPSTEVVPHPFHLSHRSALSPSAWTQSYRAQTCSHHEGKHFIPLLHTDLAHTQSPAMHVLLSELKDVALLKGEQLLFELI